MILRIVAVVLLALCAWLQYRLWLGSGGMQEVWSLRDEIEAQKNENEQLRERNRALAAEVQDLKKGTSAVEERARTDLGMIANDETFYQVVEPESVSKPLIDEKAPAQPTPAPPPPPSGGSPAAFVRQ